MLTKRLIDEQRLWDDFSFIRQEMIKNYHKTPYAIIFFDPSSSETRTLDAVSQYYYLFISWAAMNIVFLVTYDRHDAGFVLFMVHHLITLLLLGFSWFCGAIQIGVLVLYVHVASDCVLDLVKVFHYSNFYMDTVGIPVAEAGYFLNLFVWAFYRLYLFPFRVILPILRVHQLESFEPLDDVHLFLFWCLTWLLITLVFFHVYWSYRLLMLGIKIVQGKSTQKLADEELREKEE